MMSLRRFMVGCTAALLLSFGMQFWGSSLPLSARTLSIPLMLYPTPVPHPSSGKPLPPSVHPTAVTPRRRRRHRRLPAFGSPILAYPPPPIAARAALLIDMETGQILYQKNADLRLPMASTTKITTGALAIQHGGLVDLVRVSHRAASIGESTMGLRQGERVTVLQLLYGLLLNSGNDAAVALAEHVGRTVSHFVGMMNRLAGALHMTNTHYATPHGLDAPHHYTSARDLATMALYAMRDRLFRQIVETTSYHVPATHHNAEHWLASVNKVMYWYPGIDGVKPGDTDAAGLCQVVSVHRDGRRLLAVLLNTPTLVNDIRNLLNFGLHDFRWVQAPAWWDSPANVVTGGKGSAAWVYYYGAGHYLRGAFLGYFNTHGGLRTLGYPRTEQYFDGTQLVQDFQAARLIYDARYRSVYPDDLGLTAARRLAPRLVTYGSVKVAKPFKAIYKVLGGKGVFGEPVAVPLLFHDGTYQFFQYGALTLSAGSVLVVPLEDAELRLRNWLPAKGAADAYPPALASAASRWLALPGGA